MHIQDDKETTKWIGNTLEEMRAQNPPSIEDRCPHCGLSIRYPLVARQSDLELFEKMMHSAFNVMKRHGITANLLADIRAECLIAMAKRGPLTQSRDGRRPST